jgi:ferritin-like metal-binding protein YciE
MLSNIAKQESNEAQELRGLFEHSLKELYWIENVMMPMLGHSIIIASSKDLVALLESHRILTITHVQRLEKVFDIIGLNPREIRSDSLQCLIDEAENLEGQTKHGVVRDAALIAVLQKIKHHEIACYGTMRAFAIALREESAVTLLEQTLQEEKDNDLALTYIAGSHINIEAADKEI